MDIHIRNMCTCLNTSVRYSCINMLYVYTRTNHMCLVLFNRQGCVYMCVHKLGMLSVLF